jgi:hypothetical protein
VISVHGMDTILSFSFWELAYFVDLKHIKVLELKFRGKYSMHM